MVPTSQARPAAHRMIRRRPRTRPSHPAAVAWEEVPERLAETIDGLWRVILVSYLDVMSMMPIIVSVLFCDAVVELNRDGDSMHRYR